VELEIIVVSKISQAQDKGHLLSRFCESRPNVIRYKYAEAGLQSKGGEERENDEGTLIRTYCVCV
jgi:hypothetical protein